MEGARAGVLFVSTNRGLGGQSRSLLTLLAHVPSGVQRILAAPKGAVTSLAERDGLAERVVVLPFDERRRRWSRLREAAVLARLARRERRSLAAIHANGSSELNLTALATLVSGLPLVMWEHASVASPTAGLLRPFWRLFGRRVTWLAVSDTAAAVLSRNTGTPLEHIGIVPNPVDPQEVVGDPIPHEGVRVGYLGQAFQSKGFDLLPDIINGVDQHDVTFDLFVASPRPDLPVALREPWDSLAEVATRREVLLPGIQSDVRRIYAQTDIALCPSRNESFNRIAVEAMLNGIPVVASDLPAHRALLGDGEAGLLFPVGDADAAAAALTRLIEDRALRHRLGERGRVRAQAYLPERIVPQLIATYRAG